MTEIDITLTKDNLLEPEFKALITKVLTQGLQDEGHHKYEISVLITTDQEICRLNAKHRGINKPTDVLSFPQGGLCLGDIIISAPRAAAQAADLGHSLQREVAFLTAHGMYHLLGYDHQTPKEEQVMINKQQALLAKLGLA